MTRIKTLQDLFKRYRRPGDMIFALAFFLFSLALLIAMPWQTEWTARTAFFGQPAFWPAVSVGFMALFSFLHLMGALVSERIPGRLAEAKYWLRSLEFAAWFIAYVLIVPWLGYLPGSILFVWALAFRMGYRSLRWAGISALFACAVVLMFKSFLQVRIPAGELYDLLPSGALRTFFMINL
ncbi:tripartite tricarboxylate transporter TctB family protein [Psychromarinibacter sp. C21-152]|uniref:Tripartite tricarboxylate transporter TctB family protein n=1 Tax=Psychromarinibacter sediminicola TaxID=3033385 RepID=A0AAE3TB63_9RHOB|nr:tripartite tricarboxylate transporter TctB family protein [Psychromarinibacter sediminicola]MDF0602709.1 tripartite tricarboxylate transporter TctB family protein [Psychromarinibacter sediminicola]